MLLKLRIIPEKQNFFELEGEILRCVAVDCEFGVPQNVSVYILTALRD